MSVEIKIPTIDGLTLNTKNKYVKDDISITVGIPRYNGSASDDVTPEIDKFLQGEITKLYNDRVTKIIANRCEMDVRLISIYLPNVTDIGSEAFKDCSKLTSINLQNVKKINSSAFANCIGLTEVDLPSLETFSTTVFTGCSNLKSLNVPNCTDFGNSTIVGTAIETISLPILENLRTRPFNGANSNGVKCYLKTIYIPKAKISSSNVFYRASSLTTIIITQTEQVLTLPDAVTTGSFKYAYHYLGEVDATNNPDGLKDGYIYVDESMVDAYKSATNWSVLADQIKPLSEIPQEIKEELGL